jgi:hypothetical protein
MKQDLLCSWLGLPTKDWPPDHYTLLGLSAGEVDLQRIERHVQERMAKLRCYQLSHPEEATEGMNRLAQAFISLTETASKSARPAEPARRNGPPAPPVAKSNGKKGPPPVRTKVTDDTAVLHRTQLDWRMTPPPLRASSVAEPPSAPPPAEAVPVGRLVTPAPEAEDLALIHELAQRSSEARTGLATLSALINRIDQTRLLLVAWQRLGIYLRKKRLSSTAENAEFTRLLAAIRDTMDVYPAFVGHPGKPGYRVVALARLAMTFDMYRIMDGGQRDDLLRDWDIGQRILLEHRRYLRLQFKAMHRKSNFGLAWRAVSTFIDDHPLLCLGGALALLGLCILLRTW